jgi:hypothetical protein
VMPLQMMPWIRQQPPSELGLPFSEIESRPLPVLMNLVMQRNLGRLAPGHSICFRMAHFLFCKRHLGHNWKSLRLCRQSLFLNWHLVHPLRITPARSSQSDIVLMSQQLLWLYHGWHMRMDRLPIRKSVRGTGRLACHRCPHLRQHASQSCTTTTTAHALFG